MGPSPSEGAELERRNSQESTNYRRPADQQHQPSHHIQPSNPGKAGGAAGVAACPAAWPCVCWDGSRLFFARGFAVSLMSQHQLTDPSFPPQATSSSSRRLSPTATRSPRRQPLRSAMLLLEGG